MDPTNSPDIPPKRNKKVRLGTIADQFQDLPFMQSQGQVYINGIALNADIQDWYARKVGYVLQLAVPYYEELTVRQNLFFAAHMRLPKSMSHIEKFERVEQILAEVFKLFYSPFLSKQGLVQIHLYANVFIFHVKSHLHMKDRHTDSL